MFSALTRWLRPIPVPVPLRSLPGPLAAAAEHHDSHDDSHHDSLGAAALRPAFLSAALAPSMPFPAGQTDALLARLHAAAQGGGFDALRLPRLRAVVPQLLNALREDRLALAQVAKLAARDPLLAAQIIRVANSAYYGSGVRLQSITQAVTRLGRDEMRRVVLQTALRPIHPAAPGTAVHAAGERWWTHAQCTGIACAALGQGFDGMLVGLMAATGASATLGLLAHGAPELLHADAVHAAFPGAMWGIAARAAQAWELPTHVIAALQEHAIDAPRNELAVALAQAELLSMRFLLQRWDDATQIGMPSAHGTAAAWAAMTRDYPGG